MKKVWQVILVWSVMAVLAVGASVKAVVDDPNVVMGSSVQLTIEAIGSDAEFPSIEKIGPYPVERRSRMSSMGISLVNGKSTMVKSSKLVLTFTPDKAMTIPAFSVQVEGKRLKTDPIEIKVVKAAAPTPGTSRKFSLDMVTNKKSVYVGEPLLLSVYFNESRQSDLMKVAYQKPEVKDFFVKEVGEEKTYHKGGYLVHELRYLLTPKYEGNLTIEPARAKVAERGRRKDDFFGTFFDTPVWSQIVSNRVNVDVKPAPEETDLVGDLTLKETIDASEVKANKPVNLTITISGEGNLEEFEGPSYDLDGVTIYSDDAKVESHLSGAELVSSWEKKYVFIADHNFTIPSRSFSLFDYKSGKVKTLQTQAHQITVKGGKAAATVVHAAEPPAAGAASSAEPVQAEQPKAAEAFAFAADPWMLLLAFGGGIVLTLGALKLLPLLKWKRSINPMKESEALKILYPHTNDSPQVEAMVRDLYAKKGGDKSIVIDKSVLKTLVDRYRER